MIASRTVSGSGRFGLVVVVLLAALVGTGAEGNPQSGKSKAPLVAQHPRIAKSVRNDLSLALRDLPIKAPTHRRGEPEMRKPRPLHGVQRATGRNVPDPVVQSSLAPSNMPSTSRNFEGVGNVNGVLPPDTNGAVGPNHYVQWVNLSFAIYDKSGNLLYGPADGSTLWTGFGGACEFTNDGDPIVLHDDLADRWVMSQLSIPNFPFGPFIQCLAISQTPDPMGAYHRYEFIINEEKLNDYPKFGVWPDGYYLAVNQFDVFTQAFEGQGVVAFERDKMLVGQPAQMVYFDLFSLDPNLAAMLPSDVDGAPPAPGTPNFYVQLDEDAFGYVAQDQLQLWRFHVDWANPSASTFTGPVILPTAAFDSDMCGYARNCIPQPGTKRKVDAISDRLMYRLQYRNFGSYEALVVNHTVDVGGDHAGIRWYELRDPAGTPVIYQQGTYAPDNDNRWMGSIALDGAGNMALGFSVSDKGTYPSIRYAGRLAGDPLGIMAQGETELIAGSGSQTDSTGRWGDYSSMSVDPVNNCTFWYTQEYYATTSNSNWHTRIGSFAFPSCGSNLPSVTVTASVSPAAEAGPVTGTFTVSRTGSTTDDLVVPYFVTGSATPGSDYVALPGSVTIPAGSASADIVVTPIDDLQVEADETVILSLGAGSSYMVGSPSSAIVSIVSDDLPPDLVVSSLAAPATAEAGTAFSVTDTTTNQGGGAADLSTTRFYLSTNTYFDATDVVIGERAVAQLAVGASSTASTLVTIPAGTPGGNYYVLAQADADDVLPEGQETNNVRSAPIQVGADLTISAFTAPSTAGAGVPFNVTDTTKNQGGGAAGASTTRFYLSTNALLDSSDTALGERSVPALAAGAVSSATTSLTIPAGTPGGNYYILAVADADDVVAESLETNNVRSALVQMGADLTVSALSAPATGGAGAAISVTDTTKNQGGGAAGASTTRFFLSTNTLLDSSDTALGERSVPALATGASNSATTAVTIPAGTAGGYYYILAVADADNVVAEILENNNVKYAQIQIGSDLTVSALTAPATAGAGAAISVTDTTTNQGQSAAGSSTTRFYLSTNALLDASDTVLGERAVPALASGASNSATTSVTIPAGTASGYHYILAQADADNVVAESQETNNVRYALVQIGADLTVSAFSAPATGAPGAAISVADTTTNQGGGSAAASTTRFYLSTNTLLDASDTALGERAVPSLAPGASSSATTSVTIPAGTAGGYYYILAVADADNAIAETVETNNVKYSLIQMGSDLIVSALTAPPTAGAGVPFNVTDTTKNQGGGAAGASTTRFFLSTNGLLDAGDIPLGERAVPSLVAGATSSASTSVTIPAGTASGSYYVLAQADADDVVPETVETNNLRYTLIQVGPDLTVSALTVPASAGVGVPFSVTDTTANQGGGAAGASTTRFYLSANTLLDAGDTPLGERAVPALAAGAISSASTSLTIPAGTAGGNYYILAQADADNVVAETVETNNLKYALVQIGSDLIVSALTAPASAGAGVPFNVTDTTTNQGGGAAGASTTRFYLSTNTLLDSGDVVLGQRSVPSLASGASSSATTAITIPAGTAGGSYYVLAQADADGVVPETVEGNNVRYAPIQIGSDLSVTALTAPTTAGSGSSIIVTDTTKNLGSGSAGASTTRFYFSANSVLDSGDLVLGERAVAALAPGATSSASTTVTIPAGTAAGFYYILAKADADDVLAETLEGNNVRSAQIQVGPDLFISALTGPASATAGTQITLNDTTKNLGGGTAGVSTTRFYLSANALLDGSDVPLGGRPVPALAASATDSASTVVTVPAGTAAGSYFILAVADADNAVPESQEGNNLRYMFIQISASSPSSRFNTSAAVSGK